MKTLIALAAVFTVGIVSALADEPDRANALPGEIEVLRIQQDADKALLKEALLQAGRARLRLMVEAGLTGEERQRLSAESDALKVFIEKTSEAVAKRAAELNARASELTALGQGKTIQEASRPRTIDDDDRQEVIEKLEESQLEIQLLQEQLQLHQQPLDEARQSVASAEFAAENNPDLRDRAEAERQRYEKAKAKFIEFGKRLRLEQDEMGRLQESLGGFGMGGMGMGMR